MTQPAATPQSKTVGRAPFRFAVTMMPMGPVAEWTDQVRYVEDAGFDMLWCPEGSGGGSPMVALAAAAAVTTRLRLAPYVLTTPLHTPGVVAWEVNQLSRLSGGRLVLGLGTGRPDTVAQLEDLGLPPLTPGQRLARVLETVTRCEAVCGEAMPQVLFAAGGPKARAVAAQHADIVAAGLRPTASRADLAAYAAEFADAPGRTGHGVEVAVSLFSVAGVLPPWARQFVGAGLEELRAADAFTILDGDTEQMVDELERRREETGISIIGINGTLLREFLPVVKRLAGR